MKITIDTKKILFENRFRNRFTCWKQVCTLFDARKILRRKKFCRSHMKLNCRPYYIFCFITLLDVFVYLTTFSARIQDGWWQQDTCFAWSRIKIYCWSWAFCSCIIFLLFLFCTVSNCHGPWAIILYAIPIQFAKYAQVHYKVYNGRHICIHRPFWNFVGSIA